MASRRGPVFVNEFGAVYEDRICLNARKGLMSGSSREELPIRHITSVRSEVNRNAPGAVILLFFGVVFVVSGAESASEGSFALGLILVAIGAFMMAGRPSVTINTAGGDRRRSIGGPFQKAAARAFVRAVSRVLFAD